MATVQYFSDDETIAHRYLKELDGLHPNFQVPMDSNYSIEDSSGTTS